MLRVNGYVSKSSIHGRGLFAAEYIPAGSVIWSFNPKCDLLVPHQQLSWAPDERRWAIQHFGYFSLSINCFVLSTDGAQFINHSENPNVLTKEVAGCLEGLDIAVADICEGDELTMNYRLFDADFPRKLKLLKYQNSGRPLAEIVF
jgi:SET domain-containing protein